jgi:pimeloyl-ACP methyl ester carboxylesterase
VHGVFSTSADTWGDVKTGNTWPELVKADKKFKDFDINLVNYRTTYFTAAPSIYEVAKRELQRLKDKGIFNQYKEIYFVAHSMGGLVVKSLLKQLNRTDDEPLLRQVKAVVYLGTPSQGASEATLGKWLSFNPQLAAMGPAHLNQWISELEDDWNRLMDGRKEARSPRAFCAYEIRPYFLGYIVVPREAAVSRCDAFQGLDFDHSELAVPTNIDDDPYSWAMHRIDETSKGVNYQNTVTGQLSQPKSDGGHVSNIEALLADVPDPAYRQLVAAVIHVFEPKSDLAVGALVATSDGMRKIDVEVRSSDKSRFTAIDIVDLPLGRKAGIEVVDAAQSKMADVKADAILVCSNTGFDAVAIKKAKRMKIGLISVLRRGDQRVKTLIEEVMYLRRVNLNPIGISYTGETERPPDMTPGALKYEGESIDTWLVGRAMQIASFNPTIERTLTKTFNLKNPTEFDLENKRIKLRSFTISFHPHVKWFSQTVQLDATTGVYDYLRGRVRLPIEGVNAYVVQGINFEKAIPLSSPPETADFWGGLIPGEIDVRFIMFDNLWDGLPDYISTASPIDALVRPEDRTTRIASTP